VGWKIVVEITGVAGGRWGYYYCVFGLRTRLFLDWLWCEFLFDMYYVSLGVRWFRMAIYPARERMKLGLSIRCVNDNLKPQGS